MGKLWVSMGNKVGSLWTIHRPAKELTPVNIDSDEGDYLVNAEGTQVDLPRTKDAIFSRADRFTDDKGLWRPPEDEQPEGVKLWVALLLFVMVACFFVGTTWAVTVPLKHDMVQQTAKERNRLQHLRAITSQLRQQLLRLAAKARESRAVLEHEFKERQMYYELRIRMRQMLNKSNVAPYKVITKLEKPHVLPARYGQIQEKTIWIYFHNPSTCPNSQRCKKAPYAQLCLRTIWNNRGSFAMTVLHRDEIEGYLSHMELPLRWAALDEQLQRDAVHNALLARYGGVVLDISTILLRPLDDYWDEMVAKGATFRGYMFRLNGQPWRHPETTPYWFLMSRREGIFSGAVRSQVIGVGDKFDTSSDYPMRFNAFGDQTLVPLLTMLNYSLPRCIDDSSVGVLRYRLHGDFRLYCPESRGPEWWQGLSGPARNDTRTLLRDPRDGPLLPFAWIDMETWNVSGGDLPPKNPREQVLWDQTPGAPLQEVNCTTQQECWETYVVPRYFAHHAAGEAPLMSFVHIGESKAIKLLSFRDIVAQPNTFFCRWLQWAGLDLTAVAKEVMT